LLISASGRRIYLLPLFPAFALLAAPAMLDLPPALLKWINKIIRVAFTLAAVGLWLLWWTLQFPPTVRPFAWYTGLFSKWLPLDFLPGSTQPVAIFAALAAAGLWAASWRFNSSPRKTARSWFTGAALLWCTMYTLLLPWIDETDSYKSVFKEMVLFVNKSPYANECIGDNNLDENISPMVEHYTGKTPPKMDFDHPTCRLILVSTGTNMPEELRPHWKLFWHGSRPRPHDIENEELRLYLYDAPVKH
jgi:hypothetical protein